MQTLQTSKYEIILEASTWNFVNLKKYITKGSLSLRSIQRYIHFMLDRYAILQGRYIYGSTSSKIYICITCGIDMESGSGVYNALTTSLVDFDNRFLKLLTFSLSRYIYQVNNVREIFKIILSSTCVYTQLYHNLCYSSSAKCSIFFGLFF